MNSVQRVLLVHAHSGDADSVPALLADGGELTVLTGTRGADPQAFTDRLRALGVTDHRYLGDENARWTDRPARRYEESGSGGAATLLEAPFGEVTSDIASVISGLQPQVVVSVNEAGGDGHPDGIRVHQATRRATEVLRVPFYAAEPDGSFRRVRPPERESSSWRDQTLFTKISGVLFSVLLGGIGGLLMTAIHQSSVLVGDVQVPWGLVLAVLSSIALIVGLRITFDSRVLSAAAAAAFLGAMAFIASPTAGGSVVIPNNVWGLIWTIAPVAVTTLTLAWPRLRPAVATRIEAEPAVKGSSIQ